MALSHSPPISEYANSLLNISVIYFWLVDANTLSKRLSISKDGYKPFKQTCILDI